MLQEAAKGYKDNEDLSIGLAGPYAIAMEANERMPRRYSSMRSHRLFLCFCCSSSCSEKRLAAVALASVTLVAALVWTLGAAYLIFGELNMVSSIVTAMLMGLGIDYVVHVFGRSETEYKATGILRGAIEAAMGKPPPASLPERLPPQRPSLHRHNELQGLHNLGIIAGIGVMACLASTLILMPALMTLIERLRKGLLFSDRQALLGTSLVSRITNTHPEISHWSIRPVYSHKRRGSWVFAL